MWWKWRRVSLLVLQLCGLDNIHTPIWLGDECSLLPLPLPWLLLAQELCPSSHLTILTLISEEIQPQGLPGERTGYDSGGKQLSLCHYILKISSFSNIIHISSSAMFLQILLICQLLSYRVRILDTCRRLQSGLQYRVRPRTLYIGFLQDTHFFI